ncbi:hypothetical protein [Pseudoxanthomonas sp. J35]|uniref:hypothetical protein n=1 Tax=Pseudoxanthomonas sp. J35 TaxID=935852 RepID=UPI00055C52FB|nr:hypothetical protein [Pseudoxanthomonas sp. J35]
MFAIFFLAMAWKSNDALSNPQFWAEDATIFFAQQLGSLLPQIFVPYAGYLHATPRLIAWFASFFSLEFSPLIYNFMAVLIAAGAMALTCRRLQGYIPVPVVVLSFLLVPTNGEIFGTITNSQWFLQFWLAACCITPGRAPRGVWGWLRDAALLIVCITGPFSILLACVVVGLAISSATCRKLKWDPFEGALSRFTSDSDWRALAILGVGAVVQFVIFINFSPQNQAATQPVLSLLSLTFGQVLPLHTFGTLPLNQAAWLLVDCALIALLLFCRRTPGSARLVIASFVCFAFVETFVSVRLKEVGPMAQFMIGDRYFYLPKIAWWWMVWHVVAMIDRQRPYMATLLVSAGLILVAALNTSHLRRPALVDMHWRENVTQLDAPGSYVVPFNPGGWNLLIEVRAKKEEP